MGQEKAVLLQTDDERLEEFKQSDASIAKKDDPQRPGHLSVWNIEELEIFFTTQILPARPIKLDQCSTITDTSQFIKKHLEIVRSNNGKETFLPYLYRLQGLKELIELGIEPD